MMTYDIQHICSNVDLSYFKGRSVLITGASGLVGSCVTNVVHHLVQNGMDIDLHLVTKNGFQKQSKNIVNSSRVWQGDLTSYDFCKALPECDVVIHAAGYGQPMKFMENPIKTISLNTTTTCMLFEKLKPFGRFLYISSSEIYEGSCILPYKEEDIGRTTPHHTRSCYIEGKRCGEAICSQYNRNGYCAKIARLSLAYGPGTRTNDTRAINSFIRQGLSGEITLLDDGAALRTYCYIADAIEIIMNILINGNDCVYNVGGESRTSIAGLAKLIGNIMNVPVNIPETSKFLRGAPQDVMLDLTKIKTEFNKTSFVPLETGLVNTIAWQRDLYKQEGL